ncbi:hypothetical protein PUR29_33010 [Methylobacterium ajmalii]|uniref:Uncharacterized protein n=1 Tax=Methylobacterium ajmalii TaxID=2738439 RepID=A0ABV0A605_9HYPH
MDDTAFAHSIVDRMEQAASLGDERQRRELVEGVRKDIDQRKFEADRAASQTEAKADAEEAK